LKKKLVIFVESNILRSCFPRTSCKQRISPIIRKTNCHRLPETKLSFACVALTTLHADVLELQVVVN
jgi:hypothetical protein